MNGQLVGFLVKGKLTPGKNFYKAVGIREPLIIANTDTKSCHGSLPLIPYKSSHPGHFTPMVRAHS